MFPFQPHMQYMEVPGSGIHFKPELRCIPQLQQCCLLNPRLGIEGGISILGTSGIVEPMSETALIKSIETEVNQQLANGRHNLIVTLGNYGKAYLEELDRLPMKDAVKCSNYIGVLRDMGVAGRAEVLLFLLHFRPTTEFSNCIKNESTNEYIKNG